VASVSGGAAAIQNVSVCAPENESACAPENESACVLENESACVPENESVYAPANVNASAGFCPASDIRSPNSLKIWRVQVKINKARTIHDVHVMQNLYNWLVYQS
jgi:hypothetical protein